LYIAVITFIAFFYVVYHEISTKTNNTVIKIFDLLSQSLISAALIFAIVRGTYIEIFGDFGWFIALVFNVIFSVLFILLINSEFMVVKPSMSVIDSEKMTIKSVLMIEPSLILIKTLVIIDFLWASLFIKYLLFKFFS